MLKLSLSKIVEWRVLIGINDGLILHPGRNLCIFHSFHNNIFGGMCMKVEFVCYDPRRNQMLPEI